MQTQSFSYLTLTIFDRPAPPQTFISSTQASKDTNIAMTKAELHSQRALAQTVYTDSREVNQLLQLKPGSYIIVPTTYEANLQSKFIIRVFSHVPLASWYVSDNRC